ncbi:MAG: hypothetical protein ACKVJF_13290 [Flavobacteriales bacterium]
MKLQELNRSHIEQAVTNIDEQGIPKNYVWSQYYVVVIGQLLEYCLYPNVNEAESIVLVSHVAPSDEVKNYIHHLKNFIKLPFSYIHFDIEQEEIILEI